MTDDELLKFYKDHEEDDINIHGFSVRAMSYDDFPIKLKDLIRLVR